MSDAAQSEPPEAGATVALRPDPLAPVQMTETPAVKRLPICPGCRRPVPPLQTACGPCLALMWLSRSIETLGEHKGAPQNDEKAPNCP
jgi:hypothetical protein